MQKFYTVVEGEILEAKPDYLREFLSNLDSSIEPTPIEENPTPTRYPNLNVVEANPTNIKEVSEVAGEKDVVILEKGIYPPTKFRNKTTVYAPKGATFSGFETVVPNSLNQMDKEGVWSFKVRKVLGNTTRRNFQSWKLIPYVVRVNGEMAIPSKDKNFRDIIENRINYETNEIVSVKPKAYFYDSNKQEIWFSCFDDTPKHIEVSYHDDEIFEFMDGGTLEGVIIEGRAGNSKNAAMVTDEPTNIIQCLFRHNSQAGLIVKGFSHNVINSMFLENGHSGLDMTAAMSGFFDNNMVAKNNTRFLNPKWHGNKVSHSRNLIINNHYSIYNDCPGLWFDINNKNIEVNNLITVGNLFTNEMYELNSTDITVKDGYNALQRSYEGAGAAVQIQATKDVYLKDRTLYSPEGHAIVLKLDDNRGSSGGEFEILDFYHEGCKKQDLYVEGNNNQSSLATRIYSDRRVTNSDEIILPLPPEKNRVTLEGLVKNVNNIYKTFLSAHV